MTVGMVMEFCIKPRRPLRRDLEILQQLEIREFTPRRSEDPFEQGRDHVPRRSSIADLYAADVPTQSYVLGPTPAPLESECISPTPLAE